MSTKMKTAKRTRIQVDKREYDRLRTENARLRLQLQERPRLLEDRDSDLPVPFFRRPVQRPVAIDFPDRSDHPDAAPLEAAALIEPGHFRHPIAPPAVVDRRVQLDAAA